MFLNSLCILLHLCFHRKHTANPGRLPDSQICALHAPSHSIYAAMVFACGLPAHSDRIVRESHPISYYPDRTYSPARHLNQLMKLYKKLYHFLQGCRNRVLLFACLSCLVFWPYAQWVWRSFYQSYQFPAFILLSRTYRCLPCPQRTLQKPARMPVFFPHAHIRRAGRLSHDPSQGPRSLNVLPES